MEKELDSLTVVERDSGTLDNGESLQIYMKSLQKLPLLTKDQEITFAKQIKESKENILTLCVKSKDCLTNVFLLKSASLTEQRKLFFTMLSEDSDTDEIAKLSKKLDKLVNNVLEKKDKSTEKLVKFLNQMNFTFNDLQKLSAPVKDSSPKAQVAKLNKELESFKTSKNKLIEGNLRLVFARAKLYVNKGLALEDLIQEGTLGLIKAIEKYDHTKGYKFGTYATWWINQALGRSLADKARLIRVPVHMVENINKLTKATKKLTQQLGRVPTAQELSKFASVSEDKINKVKALSVFPQSTEQPMNEIGIPLSDYLADVDSLDPYEVLERKQIAEKIRFLISKLEPREQKIIRMRFGIGEKKPALLNDIGLEHDISRERARQIIENSLIKLGKISCRESVFYESVNANRIVAELQPGRGSSDS